MYTLMPHRRALVVSFLAVVFGVGASYRYLAGSTSSVSEARSEPFSEYVDDAGNISFPYDYQTSFVHLGTFAVSKHDGPTDEVHGVYARQEDVEAYRRDGRFPDGAVLVKDVYETQSARLTTGNASWGTDLTIWFVMIKDARGRFEGNELWGDGWGWALFDGKDPEKQIATSYRADCRACHVPARKDDWIYVDGYPVLRGDATGKR